MSSSDAPDGVAGYYRKAEAPPPDPIIQSRAILQRAASAGAPFVACELDLGEVQHYDWRMDGPDGPGYYRRAGAPESADPREASLCVLREAAAAGADFVRCPNDVGHVAGYDYRDGNDGLGYYRRADAPPPDGREFSRMVLQRASAAGALFVACPNNVMDLQGYEFRLAGEDGRGYYKLGTQPAARTAPIRPAASSQLLSEDLGHPACSSTDGYDEFLASMKELGALG